MSPKLVILRGRPTSGKTTAFHTLRKSRTKLNDWVFIDFPRIKSMFDKLKNKKEIRKRALFAMIKEVMKSKKNILFEEMSRESMIKYAGNYIKKYKYKIITFQFEVSLKEAYKRNIQRAKKGWHPYLKRKELNEFHKMHDERFDKKAILVDTNKLNKKQVVELILSKIT